MTSAPAKTEMLPGGLEGAPGTGGLPAWLQAPEDYEPPRDHDGFLSKSALSLLGILAHLRLDTGQETRLSPSAPVKLLYGLALILLTSLCHNSAFLLCVLAAVLVREALLPSRALRRCLGISCAAAAMSFCIMLPAVLLGQAHSALLVGAKVLATTGIALCVALSTPVAEFFEALRRFHVPGGVVMAFELALRGIADLGRAALEILAALGLRSVGHNAGKGGSLGAVMGMTFLKGGEMARQTADAMRCRCFEGQYGTYVKKMGRVQDVFWIGVLILLGALFLYLEGVA